MLGKRKQSKQNNCSYGLRRIYFLLVQERVLQNGTYKVT